MIKISVIGHGFSAQTFHMPLIEACDRFNLTAISTSKAALVKKRYPEIELYSSPQDLIQNTEADLVVITSPNESHYKLAKDCLEHGKHVILEKPMVCSSKEGEELLKIAKEKGQTLSVFHNRRWDGDFLTIQKLIPSGVLGDIRFFESHFDRFRPVVRDRWRERPGPGAGMWFDLGSHLVDQAVCLFGMPEALTARCLASREQSQAADYFHVLFHYKNIEVVLHSSSFSAGPNPRFHIQGTKGSYVKYGLDPQEDQLKNNLSQDDLQFGQETSDRFGILYTESGEEPVPTECGSYLSYYEQIADAINTGAPPPVSATSGLQVIRLLELAELSSNEGRTIQIN